MDIDMLLFLSYTLSQSLKAMHQTVSCLLRSNTIHQTLLSRHLLSLADELKLASQLRQNISNEKSFLATTGFFLFHYPNCAHCLMAWSCKNQYITAMRCLWSTSREICTWFMFDIDGLAQDCSNSSALAMELLQSCTKPSIWSDVVLYLSILLTFLQDHVTGWQWQLRKL